MGDTKFGALVLIIILGFVVGVLPAALADGAEPTPVENEELTVDYENESSVAQDGDFYSETLNIQDQNNDDLEEDVDYIWHPGRGNVTWIDTTATTEGEFVDINYTAFTVTDESRSLSQLVSLFTLPLGLLVALLLGGTAWQAVKS